tara:strand:+ start:96 stop:347 length:252 start_codon:yes stop_codon:yes gene_type:complete
MERPTEGGLFIFYMSDREKLNRMVRTLAENSKNKPMTRKVDTYEYQSLADCIRSDQVPASEVAEIFTDKAFYKWYKEKYWTDK